MGMGFPIHHNGVIVLEFAFPVQFEFLPPAVIDHLVVGNHWRETFLQFALENAVTKLILL